MINAMFVPLSKLGFLPRRLAASVLMLWLAGIGCIVGCEMHVAAATKEEPVVTSEEESCTATSGHGCCKEVRESDKTFAGLRGSYMGFHKDSTNVTCCQPTAVTADPARKLSPKGKLLASANSRMPVVLDYRISTTLPANRLRVPDRGGTHLRCCVFLI